MNRLFTTERTAALSHIKKSADRDSHKAVQIAVTPHQLIAAEVPFELSLSKPNATITQVYPIGYLLYLEDKSPRL